jgi:hypothetical protein
MSNFITVYEICKGTSQTPTEQTDVARSVVKISGNRLGRVQQKAKGVCPCCGFPQSLKKDGTIASHKVEIGIRDIRTGKMV